MIKANNKTIVFNIITSISVQVVTIVCGFILPKVILNTFGSEVNGLVSSLTQVLSYINLLEGGISGVIQAALYKPIIEKNGDQINSVINTAQAFFRKIAIVMAIYSVSVAVLYPLIVKNELGFAYVSSLTLILSITLFLQYIFSITYKLVLTADGKVFIISIVQIIVTILNTVLTIVLIKMYPSIHLVKFGSALVYLLQPIVFTYFVRKEYKLDKSIKSSNALLAQRWDGFAINIAAFVHNNTDIVVITLILGLKEVSVYSVYYLVVSGLKRLIIAVSQSFAPRIGQVYASGDTEKLKKDFHFYELVILLLTFFCFTVGGLCVTQFVQLYTLNIHDADYNRPLFGWLLMISEMIFCIREPYVTMAYSANRFKQFTFIAYAEAVMNIVISVVLAYFCGIIGIAIGTVVSMGFRTVAQILYLHKHILRESLINLFKGILVFTVSVVPACILSAVLVKMQNVTVASWIMFAVVNCVIVGVGIAAGVMLFYRNQVKNLLALVRRK